MIEDEEDINTKDEESRDICHEVLDQKPIYNVTYMENHEATDLWKKKQI